MVATQAEVIAGREAELASLAAFLDALAAGPASLVLEGEAGIGKTALWGAGVASARARNYRVLVCRPVEAETKMAFAALGDLLGPLLDGTLLHLPSPQKRALEVALLRTDDGGSPPDPRAIGMGLLGVLRLVAAEGPLIVAVDDVQWLDVPSAGAMEFALRRLSGERVGLLVSLRIGEKRRLPIDLGSLPGTGLGKLIVGPVDPQVLDKILRRHLQADFRPPTLRRLHAASGGNPLFALEIARVILQQGEPPAGVPLPVPKSLHALIHRRLVRLPPATREALTAAALLANPTISLAASGRGELLVPGLDAGVILLEDGQLRFTHPLIASTLVNDAPLELLRRLHEHLASQVADPEERARHLALSADRPNAGVAAALDEAALSAGRRGAPTAAAELAEQAGHLTPHDAVEDLQRRKITAAEQLLMAGDYPRAHRMLEQAIAALAPGPMRARALMSLGVVQAHELDDWDRSFATLEQAAAEAGNDLRLRFETERQLGHTLLVDFHAVRAEPHLRTALRLAEELGNDVFLAEALAEVADLELHLGLGLRDDLIERALSLGTFNQHERFARNPHWLLMQMFLNTGQLGRARESLQALLRFTQDRGEESGPAWILFKLGEVEIAGGNWQLAADYARRGYEIAVQTAQEAPRINSLATLADINAYLGRVEEARSFWLPELGDGDAVQQMSARGTLAMLELSMGNAGAAWEYLAPLESANRELGLNEPTIFPYWADAIEALITLGRLGEARPLLEWLEERGRTLDRPWALATGARCRALFLAASGDFGGAFATAERALVAHERLESPYERARTLLAKGMIERRAKQKRSARASLQAAAVIFDELGAARWAERARGELQRIGGRTRPSGLTETEQRIAGLVADGKSNREIAQAMFLSVKTVEANLSRIYATVGVASRTELARTLLTEADLAGKPGAAAGQTEGVPGFPPRFRVLRSR